LIQKVNDAAFVRLRLVDGGTTTLRGPTPLQT
jgi:hypothetical protein